MTPQIYWILKATVNEGQLDALKTLTKTFVELTQNEEGALSYEWSLSSDGTELHIFERYTSSDAALSHLGNVGAKLPELMALVEIYAVEFYGAASDDLKDALKDIPVQYFDTYSGFSK